jgi:hypothetical protein
MRRNTINNIKTRKTDRIVGAVFMMFAKFVD